MKYQHIFFDLDHTIWDFEANAKATLLDLYAQHRLTDRGIESFPLFFERYSYHNERLWDRYTKGFIKQDELRWKRMWLALLDFKIADEMLSHQMAVGFLEQLPLKNAVFPYTIEILNYLTAKNYQLHLITNGFEAVQQKKLYNAQLQGFFQKVITSEVSNSLKPNKEIFLFAMEQTGARVENSIMIGDNLDADIQGAINVGMDSVFVNHLGIQPHIPSTYMVHHLQQLESIF
ncbi:YjjG family noncanonical pyrimidine nucleotidase [Hydrotalea sp.]|uniref:YjjG family noncanonical pyrimidine nucleotidase n=1 Tax=Hydrotalea sp. TaxID=2881279 RepID=UPI002625AFE5|nr:YjjG family noncanonical pyrimidine nucleotidase [Hydrotalea sp.]